MTTSHFHNNKVRLKCLATIAGLYWKTADVTLIQEHPKLLQTKDGMHIVDFVVAKKEKGKPNFQIDSTNV